MSLNIRCDPIDDYDKLLDSCINKTNSCISPETSLQIATEEHHAGEHPSHESAVTDQSCKSIRPIVTDLMLIVAFEVAIVALVKRDENRHNFT
jgi:hypothetical protein